MPDRVGEQSARPLGADVGARAGQSRAPPAGSLRCAKMARGEGEEPRLQNGPAEVERAPNSRGASIGGNRAGKPEKTPMTNARTSAARCPGAPECRGRSSTTNHGTSRTSRAPPTATDARVERERGGVATMAANASSRRSRRETETGEGDTGRPEFASGPGSRLQSPVSPHRFAALRAPRPQRSGLGQLEHLDRHAGGTWSGGDRSAGSGIGPSASTGW